MVNYGNGKIYKLVNSVATDGNCYYGSTCHKLKSRKYNHKTKYHCWKRGKDNYITSFKLFEEDFENVKVILVEYYPCDNKRELQARERFWIENNKCLNKIIPNRTRKEWIELNKEKLKDYQNQYRQQNKIKINEYNKEKIECPKCKSKISRRNIRQHQRTKRCSHINN